MWDVIAGTSAGVGAVSVKRHSAEFQNSQTVNFENSQAVNPLATDGLGT